MRPCLVRIYFFHFIHLPCELVAPPYYRGISTILNSPSNTLLLLKYFFSIKKIFIGFPIAVDEGRGVGLHPCIPCEMFRMKRPSAFTRQGYSLFFLLFPLFQAAVAKRRRVLAHLLRIQLNYLQPDTSAKRLNHKR